MSGLILPGDHVDIMSVNRDRGKAETILSNIEVFAIDSETKRMVDENGGTIQAKTVSVQVLPEQATKLTYHAAQRSGLRLALRSKDDDDLESAPDSSSVDPLLALRNQIPLEPVDVNSFVMQVVSGDGKVQKYTWDDAESDDLPNEVNNGSAPSLGGAGGLPPFQSGPSAGGDEEGGGEGQESGESDGPRLESVFFLLISQSSQGVKASKNSKGCTRMYAAVKTGTVGVRARWLAALAGAIYLFTALNSVQAGPNDLDFHVEDGPQRLEMVVDTSRILTLDEEIPRVLVNNQALLKVVPLSPNKVQVSAIKPGVTQVNLWGKSGEVRSVDVVVYADARQLELVLQSEFPDAAIRVRPLASSVILTGFVDRPEIVDRVVRIAEDYYPKVINNISIGGVQQVSLHVRVMEVQRSKLRSLGVDWAFLTGNDFIVSTAAGVISATSSIAAGGSTLEVLSNGAETLQVGVVDGSNIFNPFVEALRTNNFLKILAEPTLVTVSGRPASFNEGGEFPVIIPQGLGQNTIQFKTFGTRVDFVPIVLGNGNIRLEVRPEVSELDITQGININGVVVPGLRSRFVDTAVEMRAGQTLALAGLIQSREVSTNRGIPWLADLPWAGALFRKVSTDHNEVELLVTVRPELVAALDPHQLPPSGPGEMSTLPGDIDLYGRGYIEVPKCCPDERCPGPRRSSTPPAGYPINGIEGMPAPTSYQPVNSGAVMQPGMTYGETMPMENYGAPAEGYQQQPIQSYGQPIQQGYGQPIQGYGQPAQTMVPGGNLPGAGESLLGPTGYDEVGY